MKKAAVYDRWLYTLGGGEQVAFNFASMLRDLGYETSILTHKQIDKKKAEAKLSVNLRGISIEYLPSVPSNEMSQFTEKYDVFVNTSYLDYFPNRAKVGILSIFFPSKIFLTPLEFIKRAFVVPSLRRFFIYPTSFEGFRFDQFLNGKIYKWLGKESTIVFNDDISNITLRFHVKTAAFSVFEQMKYLIDGVEVHPQSQRLQHTKNMFEVSFMFDKKKKNKFTFVLPNSEYTEQMALLSVTINDVRFALYNLFKKYFPTWEMRLHGGPGVTKRADIESYDQIVTISEFSRKWIKAYWGFDSAILFPTTEVQKFKATGKKKNWIIHVGRFFLTGHSKKQLELVKVFTKLVSEQDVDDWELHFVGSVHEGERHQQYFNQVQHQAEGYPVFFHTDVSFSELHDLLAQAKIYWHATGLDEDEETQPILFEHFGITTVEAMASGCVPVVINAGGQKEIVTKESGFLWNTRDELHHMTSQLMEDPELLHAYSLEARKRSLYFDKAEGTKRFGQLITSILKEK